MPVLVIALRRRTARWIGTAACAGIFYIFACIVFVHAIWKREPRQSSSPLAASSFDINSISKDKELARYLKEQGEADVRYGRAHQSPTATISVAPSTTPLAAHASATVISIAENIQRAVVLVSGFNSSGQMVASGTGFFVSPRGHVMTCWHILAHDKIDNIQVTRMNGTGPYVEGVVGFSATNDLVLLKTSTNDTDLLPIRAKDGDKPEVGMRILVFGNPGQLRGVWSEGAVSGFTFAGEKAARDSLRFEAPVAPGSSGSPVVDLNKGDVVGIASAAGWMLGNLAVPFYYMTELLDQNDTSTAVPVAEFKANLEKEKPALKEQVYEKERSGDLREAARLCEEYTARYPGDVFGPWEHAQISFAEDDYNAANYYVARLEPVKEDPGDDLVCAIQFETGDALYWAPVQRQWLTIPVEFLRRNYAVEIYKAIPPGEQLNVRERPDAKASVLYQFDADEHVFAKQDRVRNRSGKEDVSWRKVRLLPTSDRIHGGEGWVNERYLAPLSLAET